MKAIVAESVTVKRRKEIVFFCFHVRRTRNEVALAEYVSGEYQKA